MKKALSIVLALAMAASMAACGGATSSSSAAASTPASSSASGATGSVYYLNFKPEQADQWVALAKQYTDETGVPVNVVTAASGTYESTLTAEMAKTEA
ncbi:MAG: carbohydrate ABC transporter substrate-binding protein, partial [Pygmaiobacter sp.]|nr:carbohydrate ABC transporter substrate-binding protein [Pygmaiobacter sp.]